MAAREFVKNDTPGLEPKITNESDKIQALHDLVNSIQQKNFACHRHGFRGTHVKTQGIVKGKLSVLPGLHEQHLAWLREYFRYHDAEFDFRVQLLRNVEEQSVEDCSVEWDEEKYPFETVARVTLPKGQDAFDAQRRVFWEDRMKLNPRYGIDAHRTLGSVNGLSKTLYQRSVAQRNELNACKADVISSVGQIP